MKRSPAALGVAALVLSVACGSAKRDEPEKHAFVPPDSTIAQGERVFKKQCDYCHPGGSGGIGPPLNNKPAPAFAIRFQVRHGLGAMPAFDSTKISDKDLHAVADYLKALRRSD